MSGEIQPPVPGGELILYQAEDGQTRIQCRLFNKSLWLSQALIAELFQVTVPTVNEHLKGIYAEGELQPEGTIRKFRIVRREGTREVATAKNYLRENEITELNRIVAENAGEAKMIEQLEQAAKHAEKIKSTGPERKDRGER